MLSILMPAKDEEHYLPRALSSIRSQDFKDLEIIVADAKSTDNTVQIAEDFGCKVVEGGLPGIGANAAARAASGETLLFLAADIFLPEGFISRNLREFSDRRLVCATTDYVPISNWKGDHFVVGLYNVYARLTQRVYPMAGGFCIFSTKKVFDVVNGFDERIKMGEDFEYVKKCAAQGRFGILDSVPIHVDIRRLEKDGRLSLARKYIQGYFHRIFKGEMYEVPFEYDMQGVNVGKEASRDRNEHEQGPDRSRRDTLNSTPCQDSLRRPRHRQRGRRTRS